MRGRATGTRSSAQFRELSEGEIAWTDGMLYPVLHRLESQGLVHPRWDVSEAGRKRKYYSLTAAGKRALAEQKQQWQVVQATFIRIWGMSHA